MIILIGNQKGGVGKTTIAANLAAEFSDWKKPTLLIDADPQQSAVEWAAIRATFPRLARVHCWPHPGAKLLNAVKQARPSYGIIVIDTGGRDSAELRAGMTVADRMIIPARPASLDIWSLGGVEEIYKQALTHNKKLRAAVVLNCAPTHPALRPEIDGAITALADLFPALTLSAALLHERAAYRQSINDGRAVSEAIRKNKKATAEIAALIKELKT